MDDRRRPGDVIDEGRVPEIDGIRGAAILAVFLFHIFDEANVVVRSSFAKFATRFTNMGWIGVDVFFVLSGYLITGILIRTRERSSSYFRTFYARRILRIIPAYIVTLVLLVALIVPRFDTSAGNSSYNVWYFLYLNNWLQAVEKKDTFQYLGHLWSLAIEEQYYLAWPAVVFICSVRTLRYVAASLIVVIPIYRVWFIWSSGFTTHTASWLHFATLTRLDTLMIGAGIAVSREWWTSSTVVRTTRTALSISSVLLALVYLRRPSAPLWRNPLMVTVGYSLVGAIGGALLLAVQSEPSTSRLRRSFRSGTLQFLGKYSYAMYLFHWPVALLAAHVVKSQDLHGWYVWPIYICSCAATTTGLSLVSWNLLERHALRLKHRFV